MSSIAEATPIILKSEERTELESPARSTKTEYRACVKARIVLMAADGAAMRRIARHLLGEATQTEIVRDNRADLMVKIREQMNQEGSRLGIFAVAM